MKVSDNGAGMGLAIVYGIVKKHSGDIGIRSTVVEGTDLVLLPVTADAQE